MLRAVIVSVVVLLGCKQTTVDPYVGPKGDQGEKGDTGATGPAGPAGGGSSTVWKDANGTTVWNGDQLWYVDSAGVQWNINPETAKVSVYSTPTYYSGANCTGMAYVLTYLPRVAFQLPGETNFRSRPDNLASVDVNALSFKATSTSLCSNSGAAVRAVPLQPILNTTPLTEPTLNLVPPLHIEPLK